MAADAAPLVSVVIPTHNYGRFLREAIDSVLAQTFQDLEIIVVDDASTDETRAVVAEYGDRVRYVYHEGRRPNRTRNVGLDAARGRYVAFLDADDKWLPEKLRLQLPLIEARPDVGLVYGGIRLFESGTGATVGYHPLDRCRRGRVLRELFLWQMIPSPTPLIRREVFARVGRFDEAEIAADDWEMWLRIASAYDLDFVPSPVALYRVHASTAGRKEAGAYLDAMTAFFTAASRRYPQLAPLLPLRLGSFLEAHGWRLVLRGDRAAGIARLRQASRHRPLRIKTHWLLLLARLGAGRRPERVQAAAAAYLRGRHHLHALRLAAARAEFLRSIGLSPLSDTRPYKALALSLAGKALARRLRDRRGAEDSSEDAQVPSERVSFEQW